MKLPTGKKKTHVKQTTEEQQPGRIQVDTTSRLQEKF